MTSCVLLKKTLGYYVGFLFRERRSKQIEEFDSLLKRPRSHKDECKECLERNTMHKSAWPLRSAGESLFRVPPLAEIQLGAMTEVHLCRCGDLPASGIPAQEDSACSFLGFSESL